MSLPRRILVTGASRGIGAAIAIAAAERGFQVAINFLSSTDRAAAVAEQVRKVGGEAILVQGDVRVESHVRAIAETLDNQWGGLDGLINNAHTPFQYRSIAQATWQDYEEQLIGTLRSSLLCTQAFLPLLLRGNAASILNVSSITATVPETGFAHRNAAKAALEGFTRSAAVEFGDRNIRVNAMALGWTATEQLSLVPNDLIASIQGRIPLGRLARPEEIAATAVFLLSADAAFITGTVLPVAGGLAPGVGS